MLQHWNESVPHHPCHTVANHRITHTFRGHDAQTARKIVVADFNTHHELGNSKTPTPTKNSSKIGGAIQPVLTGQHDRIRQLGERGPCGGALTKRRDQHGYAYANGSRESLHDGGCSAGKCALTRDSPSRTKDEPLSGRKVRHLPPHGQTDNLWMKSQGRLRPPFHTCDLRTNPNSQPVDNSCQGAKLRRRVRPRLATDCGFVVDEQHEGRRKSCQKHL